MPPKCLRPAGRFLALTLAAVLLFGSASDSVFARSGGRSGHSGGGHSGRGHSGSHHHGGHGVAAGVIIAAPAFWYFPATMAAPQVVAGPSAPPVYYIERGDALPAASQGAGDWWYYCADSGAYYPYVKECALEWQRVAPVPPATQ